MKKRRKRKEGKMALSIVMAVTNSDIKSMNMIKNRLKLTETLWIKIPIMEFLSPTNSETSSGFSSVSPRIQFSTPKNSPATSNYNTLANLPSEKSKAFPKTEIRVMYGGRDILKLDANVRQPCWVRRQILNQRNSQGSTEGGIKTNDSMHQGSSEAGSKTNNSVYQNCKKGGPITNGSVNFFPEEKNCTRVDPGRICKQCGFHESLTNSFGYEHVRTNDFQ